MSTEIADVPIFAYMIIDEIGDSGMDFSTLINQQNVLQRYDNDVNKIAMEIQKLRAFGMITIDKIQVPEEGDDLRLSLTKRGLGILKNPYHE